MTAQNVIDQFKALPPNERAEVAKFVVESDDSWIPETFKRGMADAEAGRFADMDTGPGRGTSAVAPASEMKYRFKPTEVFWESFYDLSSSQKESARRAWKIFKENPFDLRLRPHKIHRLSAHYGRTIYAVDIEADLRVVFYLKGDCVITVDIGTHDIYKG